MSENDFWVRVWALLSAVVIGIAFSIAYYNVDANSRIESMVKDGSHPMDAACAIDGNARTVCIAHIASTQQK